MRPEPIIFVRLDSKHAQSDGKSVNRGLLHSRPQNPRSFWPAAGIESSDRTRFSEHAQSIRWIFSANQICQIWREVRESRTSGVGQSQSSRSLPQVRMIVGSGNENGTSGVGSSQRSWFLVLTKRSAASGDENGVSLGKISWNSALLWKWSNWKWKIYLKDS